MCLFGGVCIVLFVVGFGLDLYLEEFGGGFWKKKKKKVWVGLCEGLCIDLLCDVC